MRKHAGQIGFTVHPRRSVVERFFAWIGRNRRLARDFEATLASAEAFLERFHAEWNRSSSYFASNFIGLELLRDSGQADIALYAASAMILLRRLGRC